MIILMSSTHIAYTAHVCCLLFTYRQWRCLH